MSSVSPTARGMTIGFLALVAVGFFVHRVIIEQPEGITYENYDLLHYMMPSTDFIHDSLQRSEFPTWNPYQFAGQPFAAAQVTAVFYVPNLFLAWMLPAPWALAAHTIFHLFIAGLFTLLLAGRLGLSWPAQLAASLGYMLSGALLAGLYNAPYMATHAWLPAILWSLHGLATAVRLRWGLATGAICALAFLGGHVQAFFYEIQLGFLWFIFLWTLRTPDGERLRVVSFAGVGALLALGLIAPQFLSTLELTQLGNRTLDGHRLADALVYFYREKRLVDGLWGEPGSAVGLYRWTVTFPVLLTLLAGAGFFTHRQRMNWLFFAAVALFAALFSLGPTGALYRFYFELPLGNLFRGAARISFIYALAMALLAGIGVQGIMNGIRMFDLPRWCPAAGGLLLSLAVASGLYVQTELESAHPVTMERLPGAPASVVDLMTNQQGFHRIFIRQPAGERASELTRKAGMMNRFFALPDYEPALPLDYELFFAPGSPEIWHGQIRLDAKEGRSPEELSRALDLMSVRFIVPFEIGRPIPPQLRAVGAESAVPGTPIARRPTALPRAYTVEKVVVAPDNEAAIVHMMRPQFDPSRLAVVEEGALYEGDPLLGPDIPARKRKPAEIVRYALDEVEIQVECKRRCLLVLTDFAYPGWTVRVDGERRPVVKANGIFRGVALAPGSHEVVYRYDASPVQTGFAISGVILGGLLIAFVVWGWRRRSSSG